ncbi:MAG: hypothetical protein JWN49_469 [Parcubacteria group bacterium]|nr:hypothetical protein [Parcubacteria group bacterium]
MTKKHFLILGIVVIVLLLLVVGIVVFRSQSSPQTTGTSTPGTTFPIASTTTGVATGTSTGMTINGQNGTVIATKNFIDNGITIKDVENPGTYLVAGQLGYCLPNIPCTAAANAEFNILYDSNANQFIIALLTEPLGRARKDAQAFLAKTLGLSNSDLCSLKYYITTTYTVNETYAGDNLGFNGCPGAVVLP